MSEPTVVVDDVEPDTSVAPDTAPEADTDTDLLVEEVSIDGMCGVY